MRANEIIVVEKLGVCFTGCEFKLMLLLKVIHKIRYMMFDFRQAQGRRIEELSNGQLQGKGVKMFDCVFCELSEMRKKNRFEFFKLCKA